MADEQHSMLGISKREPTHFESQVLDGQTGAVADDLIDQQEKEAELQQQKEKDEYEMVQKLKEVHRTRLKNMLQEERKMSKQNRVKIVNKWRANRKEVKTKELRRQIGVLSTSMEEQLDRYDDLIDDGLQDLIHLEDQFRTAQNSYMRHNDKLYGLHEETLLKMNKKFEIELDVLKKEFFGERDHIIDQQKTHMKYLTTIFEEVEDRQAKRDEEQLQINDTEREEIRNKNLEDFNVLKITLEGKLEKKEKEFDEEHSRYIELTDDKTCEYEILKAKDRVLAKEIDALMKRNNDLQSQINLWKKKTVTNNRECKETNLVLRQEKEEMNAHYRELKNEMQKFRESENDRLEELSTLSRESIKINQNHLDNLASILRLASICRKYEGEKEKVCSINEMERLAFSAADNLMEQKDSSRDSMPFENFWKRYNKVLLDNTVLSHQRETLANETANLKQSLNEYMSSITVSKRSVDHANPLLVVNGRVNMKPQSRRSLKTPIVLEGNDMIRNYTRQLG